MSDVDTANRTSIDNGRDGLNEFKLTLVDTLVRDVALLRGQPEAAIRVYYGLEPK